MNYEREWKHVTKQVNRVNKMERRRRKRKENLWQLAFLILFLVLVLHAL